MPVSVEPLPQSVEGLVTSLKAAGFSPEIIVRLAADAWPAILLTTDGTDDHVPLGASKIGGCPDLPVGTNWPVRPAYKDGARRAERYLLQAERLVETSKQSGAWLTPEQAELYGNDYKARAQAAVSSFPLSFFGQIDLSVMAEKEGFDEIFPREGRLLFFYDLFQMPEGFCPDSSVGWRLVWDRTPGVDLVRVDAPRELESFSSSACPLLFRPAPIHARSVLTPMPINDKAWEAFPLEDEEQVIEYQTWFAQFGTPDRKGRFNHQFGGYAQPLQNGLQSWSQLAANGVYCGNADVWETQQAKKLLPHSKDWRLVLQIGFDVHAGLPQAGAYYFMMREADIAARRFDQAWVQFQCD